MNMKVKIGIYTDYIISKYVFLLLSCLASSVCYGNNQECLVDSIITTTPSTRFTSYDNGIVADKNTGLTWKKCSEGQVWNGDSCDGNPSGYTWQEALRVVQSVNAGGFAGYRDWRLPNIKEMESIVERQCYRPAINLTIFPNTLANAWFWSSSPNLERGNADSALGISVSDGTIGGGVKFADDGKVRLVRDSQVIPPVSNPFTVQAADETGTAFTVPAGKTQCTFTATGTWQRDPNPIYVTGPNGDGYACGCSVPVPAGYVYGLVATSNKGDGFNIGNSAQITVSGGDILHFLMNDAVGAFANNSGALSVSWSCQ